MRKVHFKASQVDVYILKPGDVAPRGEITFTEDEWEWCRKLAKDLSDPEHEKNFMLTALEKKRADPKYSVFTDFPTEVAPPASKTMAVHFSQKIIAGIRGAQTPPPTKKGIA
jgi:hypothetical protein